MDSRPALIAASTSAVFSTMKCSPRSMVSSRPTRASFAFSRISSSALLAYPFKARSVPASGREEVLPSLQPWLLPRMRAQRSVLVNSTIRRQAEIALGRNTTAPRSCLMRDATETTRGGKACQLSLRSHVGYEGWEVKNMRRKRPVQMRSSRPDGN